MFIQIVISKTKPEIPRNHILDLTRKMRDWLAAQPGFLAYELCESKNSWADRITWESREHALLGNAALQESAIGKKMMSTLEPGFRGFMGTPVSL
jgi:hypothetical protein